MKKTLVTRRISQNQRSVSFPRKEDSDLVTPHVGRSGHDYLLPWEVTEAGARPHSDMYTGICYYSDFRGYTILLLHPNCHILALSLPLRHLSPCLCPSALWILSSHYLLWPPGRLNKPRPDQTDRGRVWLVSQKRPETTFLGDRALDGNSSHGDTWACQTALASTNGPSTHVPSPQTRFL